MKCALSLDVLSVKEVIEAMNNELINAAKEKVRELSLIDPSVTNKIVDIRPLTPVEAIGSPEDGKLDYPLLRKKEVLLQATFGNSIGQAFTGVPTPFKGTLAEILQLDNKIISNNAIFIATINALLREFNLIHNTVHCRNNQPVECGNIIAARFFEEKGSINVGLVGYQPAFVEAFALQFGSNRLMVTDLNAANHDKVFCNVRIEDGLEKESEVIDCSELLLVTGSVFVNGTEKPFVEAARNGKHIFFYGTTGAGPAHLLDLPQLCPISS